MVDYAQYGYQGYMPPPVVRIERASKEPMLNLSALSPQLKRHVWGVLQKEAPELVQALSEIKETSVHYDGQIIVKVKDLPASVRVITGKTK